MISINFKTWKLFTALLLKKIQILQLYICWIKRKRRGSYWKAEASLDSNVVQYERKQSDLWLFKVENQNENDEKGARKKVEKLVEVM